MDWLLYVLARAVVALLQALPLRTVAWLGRTGGGIVCLLDARHRRVATENLQKAFGSTLTPEAIQALARENFRRIGENFACAVKTASMGPDETRGILTVEGAEKLHLVEPGQRKESRVIAIGHFGNFELFAKASIFVPGYQFATTYRALRQPAINRLMQQLREKSGCLYFERRTDAEPLKAAMHEGGVVLGLLSDQHGGRKGVWGPFLGRECSTTPAPAVLALRYKCPLFPAFCFRTMPGRWQIEVGDEIPTHAEGHARPVEAITADINRAFEAAVRRDPANWFWVHKRWKPRGREAAGASDTHLEDGA
jgi:Kdo2-lipid IVA lauroyltransferase/acyltransferase